MKQSRRRFWLPWLVVAALVAALILTHRTDDGFPRLDGAPKAHVQRVVDGDTVRFIELGKVRLIGINTPEVYGRRVECFGPEASAYAKHVLRPGLEVAVVDDRGALDQDRGRIVQVGSGRL